MYFVPTPFPLLFFFFFYQCSKVKLISHFSYGYSVGIGPRMQERPKQI